MSDAVWKRAVEQGRAIALSITKRYGLQDDPIDGVEKLVRTLPPGRDQQIDYLRRNGFGQRT